MGLSRGKKGRERERNPKQLRAGWLPKPSLVKKIKIKFHLVLVATALSSKNPEKGPGK